MGSSAEIPRAPENVLFIEDMTDKQLAETLKLPSGLTNLGNTCYMNATLQCLRSMPELHQSLNRFTGGINTGYPAKNLTASLRDLFQQLNQTTEGYSPYVFLQMLRTAFPQFAQQNNNGFMQQDAEESPEEEPVITKDVFTKLNCFISERRSVNYSKYTRISRLPEYLTVQFVRFFWKSLIRKKVKVLRRVKFPLDFDLTDICTDELKKKLLPVRDRLVELEKEKLEAKEIGYDSKIEEIKKLVDPELAADFGANTTGLYELCAVLTHTGRYVDSGHYIGWVRKDDSPDDWIKYDDDKVSIVKSEEILKLDGGGT
ncbi:674_t:CDS:2 [Diversispora eburnea]|uniref:ubiquitinyl hydrolase 1 n=1 Tax=Diversispora eburnea TaxID=1213867 RepID=A0A9N9FHK9_9GLOM|nr:674_t:CDS:2 [Diversispora eburnea]